MEYEGKRFAELVRMEYTTTLFWDGDVIVGEERNFDDQSVLTIAEREPSPQELEDYYGGDDDAGRC